MVVDFDPVRASRGITGLPDELVVFPDAFEDSELGEIPDCWSTRLDEAATWMEGKPGKKTKELSSPIF